MRHTLAVVAVLFVGACGARSPQGPGPIGSSAPKAKAPDAPVVTAAGVVATDDSPPPVVVLIDPQGQRSLAAAASWADVGAGKWAAGPKRAGDEASWRAVREGTLLGKDGKGIVDGFEDYKPMAEDTRTSQNGMLDDPPPPPEEDTPDDGEESGGTGTAMALDEGKMGKRDSDRAEGQYKMQKTGEDPQLARQQAIDAARSAGILTTSSDEPVRLASVQGVVTSDKLEHVPAVVIAHPSTKAAVVVKAVSELQAMIGVKTGGTIRPLRILFHHGDAWPGDENQWLEVRLASSGLTVEAVPSKAATVTWAEAAGKLKASLAEARARKTMDLAAPVDVLVTADVDAQHLVDVLVALDGAGVKVIGLGDAPTGKQLALRGHEPERRPAAVPTVAIGNPNAQGDLDKAIIRRAIKQNLPKITYCFEKELLAKPKLEGTVLVQFFIQPDGKVKQSAGSGMDPAVATCVAEVIKGIEFPKPKGGGGVQVNYPFVFQQEKPTKKP